MPDQFTRTFDLWWSGPCRCRLCSHEWVACVNIGDGADDVIYRLECPNCHNMTGEHDEERS